MRIERMKEVDVIVGRKTLCDMKCNKRDTIAVVKRRTSFPTVSGVEMSRKLLYMVGRSPRRLISKSLMYIFSEGIYR